MKFYDKRHFRQFRYLPLYYAIGGMHKDGFSYVLYINGGEPPWTLAYPLKYVRCFCAGVKMSLTRPSQRLWFCGIKHYYFSGVLLLPMDGMLLHHRLSPAFYQVTLKTCWYPFIFLSGG